MIKFYPALLIFYSILALVSVFILTYKKGVFFTKKKEKIIRFIVMSILVSYMCLKPLLSNSFSMLIPMILMTVLFSLDQLKMVSENIFKIALALLCSSALFVFSTII